MFELSSYNHEFITEESFYKSTAKITTKLLKTCFRFFSSTSFLLEKQENSLLSHSSLFLKKNGTKIIVEKCYVKKMFLKNL